MCSSLVVCRDCGVAFDPNYQACRCAVKKQTEEIFHLPEHWDSSLEQLITALCEKFEGRELEWAVTYLDYLILHEDSRVCV